MKKLIVLGFVLLVLISACQQELPEEPTPTACPPDCSGYGGNVETEVLGDTIYANSRFTPSVNINDEGESDTEGIVCITGLNSEVFEDYEECSCQDFYVTLQDASDPNFEYDEIDFSSIYVSTEESSEEEMTIITRYKYITYGIFEVCLTGDPDRETECSESGNKLETSSAGPVNVNSIKEDIQTVGDNSITLRLQIEADYDASANQQLVALNDVTDSSCFIGGSGEDVYVDVDVILLGKSTSCGEMVFEPGEESSTITCKLDNIDVDLLVGGSKEKEGWVKLTYGFEDIQSHKFDIKTDEDAFK
ncbi:MAG: hypothetical protein Q8Q35_04055 [Nanoarchaeota archaeon]|nr:hypothetical protein [Nanoarchaeota archaeon]